MNIYLNILLTIYALAIGGSFCVHESWKMRLLDISASIVLVLLTLGAVGVFS